MKTVPSGKLATAPCPNPGRSRGEGRSHHPAARSHASRAIRPSATTTRTRSNSASSPASHPPAPLQLLASRAIARRRAARSRGDVAVAEPKPVVPAHRCRLVGEPETMEGFVEPVPARIPREHAPGAIAAVRRGREPHHQQPGLRVAEPRHRPAPVAPAAELPLLPLGDQPAPGAEPRTSLAGDDLGLDCLERLVRVTVRSFPAAGVHATKVE